MRWIVPAALLSVAALTACTDARKPLVRVGAAPVLVTLERRCDALVANA